MLCPSRSTRAGALGGAGLALLASVASAVDPSPAAAQYGQYGSPAPPPSYYSRDDRPAEQEPTQIAEVRRAAACVAGRDPAVAGELLGTVPYSRVERRRAVSLLRSAQRCVRSRVPIVTSTTLLRGAVAEILYEAQFAAARPSATARVARNRLDPDAPEAAAPLAPAIALAECSAAALPDGVRGLLATEPGSSQEGAAFGALGSTFSGCVADGRSVGADRATLRAILAESLYRWSVVQRDGPASPWAAEAPSAGSTGGHPAPALR